MYKHKKRYLEVACPSKQYYTSKYDDKYDWSFNIWYNDKFY